VDAFKRQFLRVTLEAHRGNRTHAARALGLQRTYLLRLMRDFGIHVPVPDRLRREDINGE
jgi:DNA-binding NtrC family response regulator